MNLRFCLSKKLFVLALAASAYFPLLFSESWECGDCVEEKCGALPMQIAPYGTLSFGKSPGYIGEYLAIGALTTIDPCWNLTPLVDISAYLLRDHKYAGSFGFGLRFTPRSFCSSLGVNCFYDARGCRGGNFHQIGAGVEVIRGYAKYTVNGYFPVTNNPRKGKVTLFDDYDNTGVAVPYKVWARPTKLALSGFDFEASRVFQWKQSEIEAGLGGYYLAYRWNDGNLGVKGVLKYLFLDSVVASLQGTWDRKRDFLCKFNLSYLFCPTRKRTLECCDRTTPLLLRDIQRDRIIHIQHCCEYKTNY